MVIVPTKRVVVSQATIWRRVLSFVVDILLVDLILFAPFTKFFTQSIDFRSIIAQEISLPATLLLAAFFMGIVALLYFALLEWTVGTTVGKMFFGLSVAGNRSLGRCLFRHLYLLPIFPFTILWIIEPLHLIWFKERLLERWSKTSTVQIIEV